MSFFSALPNRDSNGADTELFRPGHNLQQLNLKNQSGAAGNRWPALVSVSQIGRANQHRLSTDLHLLNALGPARNHAIERKLCGLVPAIGAVELGPVQERAAVLHL